MNHVVNGRSDFDKMSTMRSSLSVHKYMPRLGIAPGSLPPSLIRTRYRHDQDVG